jgi:hypothetical protein
VAFCLDLIDPKARAHTLLKRNAFFKTNAILFRSVQRRENYHAMFVGDRDEQPKKPETPGLSQLLYKGRGQDRFCVNFGDSERGPDS